MGCFLGKRETAVVVTTDRHFSYLTLWLKTFGVKLAILTITQYINVHKTLRETVSKITMKSYKYNLI